MRNIDECFDIIRKWVSDKELEQDFLEALNDVMVMAKNNNENNSYCEKCKYYDDETYECLFYSMGSGNEIDKPCNRKG